MKDILDKYIGIKYEIGKTYDFNPSKKSDKIKLTVDIAKMRKNSDSPMQFYNILILYFKDRPIVIKLLDKSVDKMASEVAGLSILKILANDEPDFMKTLLTKPSIIRKFGRAIHKMAKDNTLENDFSLAIGGNGEVLVGDEVDFLEKKLQESGNYSVSEEITRDASYLYETIMDADDTPNVSLRDIDTHLEGQA